MNAYILLNLLDEKIQGLLSILLLFLINYIKFNNTGA